MNVAETTPAFQEHIDGILEQHIGPGKNNATLHFHLLIKQPKMQSTRDPLYMCLPVSTFVSQLWTAVSPLPSPSFGRRKL